MPPIYGVNIHYPHQGHAAVVQPAGFQVVRIDVNMDLIETAPGVWDWSLYDTAFARLADLGLWIYPTLAHLPPWVAVHNNAPPRDAAAVQAWAAWLDAVLERYGRYTDVWSVWNEPNGHGTPPDVYVRDILAPAAQAIRRHVPHAIVAGPELATTGAWQPWLRTCLRLGRPWLDAVAVHAYGGNGREVARRMFQGRDSVRAQMTQEGYGAVPLGLTEYGVNSARVGVERQASFHDQFLEIMAERDDPCLCLAYQLVDEDPTEHFGLVHSDLRPKPAYHIYQRRVGGVV